jgi:hypothetical protein
VAALRLGDIIASPFDPEEAINGDPPPSVPNDLLRTFEQRDWSWKKEFSRSHSGGVFASFLEVVGLGPEVELSQSKSAADIYNAERLVTEYFIPNRQYIEDSINDPDVKDQLTGPNRKSKLFMITGLKVAYGATRALEVMNKHGIHAQIAVNLAALGAPISVGPKTDVSASTKENLSFGKLDFVFGLQVRELRYKKGQVVHQKYDKGSLYGQKPSQELDDDNEEAEDIDLEALEVEEPSLSELDGVKTRTVDDGVDEEAADFVFL